MPTDTEGLPTLEREQVEDWLRRSGGAQSLARLLMPEAVPIELAQVGRMVVRPRCVEPEAGALGRLATSCEAFSLDAIDGGVLLIEHGFARHLSNAMVGLPGPLSNRPLSRVERGMVAGLAAVSLAKLGLPLGVRAMAETSLLPSEDALCVHVRVELSGMDGHAWLCATTTAWGRAWDTLGIADLLAPLSVELARTQLARAEAVAGRPQDLLVFDDTPACPPGAPLPVDLCCRGKRVPVRLDRDGCVCLDDAMATTRRIRSPRKSLLQADFVEVTAEFGRTRAAPGSDGVLLRMGEWDWAEGVLTAQQDRLAVRITRILRKPPVG